MANINNEVLVIAGVDPSGKSGVYADLDMLNQFSVDTIAINTMQTATMPDGVFRVQHAVPEIVGAQLSCVTADVIKMGAIGNEEIADVLIDYLVRKKKSVVFDPVIKTTSGHHLSSLEAVKKILPFAYILTPNIFEAEQLAQMKIDSSHAIKKAAQKILAQGCHSVLITGGHLRGKVVSDYYTDGATSFWLNTTRVADKRGTGCRLSSAIAGSLAEGCELSDSVVRARMMLQEYLGSTQLPWLCANPQGFPVEAFPECGAEPLGLYPIVDSAQKIASCAQQFSTMQLRIKKTLEVEQEIVNAVAYSQKNNVRLFVNDHWQLAIKHKAYGVHLGQEDLLGADVDAIKRAGLRLGVSTHCYMEVARANAVRPSYIAYGPVFPTTSKPMRFNARGVVSLCNWCAKLNYPVVAIGGITPKEYPAILDAGANGVAFISALPQFLIPDPQRYQRQITLENIGELGQKKLHDAKVLVVGVGGLGSPLAIYLAACGVGRLGLVDGDVVAKSNLHRQIVFNDADVGMNKTQCARRALQALNPHCQVQTFDQMLTTQNAHSIISQYDIIADCTDNFFTKYLINDACVQLEKPFVMASVERSLGQLVSFSGKNGPCYRCLFESIDDSAIQNCEEAGILGVVPGILGTLQASEVIKLILRQNGNFNQLLMVNTNHLSTKKIPIQQNKRCPACFLKLPFDQLSRPHQQCDRNLGISFDDLQVLLECQPVRLIDVRTKEEFQREHLPTAINIPLAVLDNNIDQLDTNATVVVYCQHGPRSQKACSMLVQYGFGLAHFLIDGVG